MSSDNNQSISYLLGLNEFQENVSPAQNEQTDALLAGLNMLPSTSPQDPDDAVSHFSQQLSLWTNANFSFDGPMGHALIGDDEKDGADEEGRREEEERMQRHVAASGAHSNAARDKMRDIDREAPLPAVPSKANEPSSTSNRPQDVPNALPAAAPAPNPMLPPHAWNAPPMQPNSGWDITSTLALQYLLTRNPNVSNNFAPGTLTGPPAHWPSTQPPAQHSSVQHQASSSAPLSNTSQSFLVPPTSSSASANSGSSATQSTGANSSTSKLPSDPSTPKVTPSRKRSVSNTEPLTPKAESKSEEEDELTRPLARRGNSSSLAERVKLVDTGNPEADAEANRLAIEEDKRRRNTAASARFRIKKKQREAALELSARELENQVGELKQENERLRTENEWLRRLITARPEGISSLLGTSLPTHAPPSDVQHPQQYPMVSLNGLHPNMNSNPCSQ